MDVKKLIELRKEAEKAVSDMPDGDLKLKAFEVILGRLMSDSLEPKVLPTEETKEEGFLEKSVAGRLLVLKEEGFFKNPKALAEIRQELQTHGWHYPNPTIAHALIKLVQKKRLRRQKVIEANKKPWKYSNP